MAEQVAEQVIEVEYIRLPCSHLIERPSTATHITCEHDNRKWHIYYKGVEVCAREEF